MTTKLLKKLERNITEVPVSSLVTTKQVKQKTKSDIDQKYLLLLKKRGVKGDELTKMLNVSQDEKIIRINQMESETKQASINPIIDKIDQLTRTQPNLTKVTEQLQILLNRPNITKEQVKQVENMITSLYDKIALQKEEIKDLQTIEIELSADKFIPRKAREGKATTAEEDKRNEKVNGVIDEIFKEYLEAWNKNQTEKKNKIGTQGPQTDFETEKAKKIFYNIKKGDDLEELFDKISKAEKEEEKTFSIGKRKLIIARLLFENNKEEIINKTNKELSKSIENITKTVKKKGKGKKEDKGKGKEEEEEEEEEEETNKLVVNVNNMDTDIKLDRNIMPSELSGKTEQDNTIDELLSNELEIQIKEYNDKRKRKNKKGIIALPFVYTKFDNDVAQNIYDNMNENSDINETIKNIENSQGGILNATQRNLIKARWVYEKRKKNILKEVEDKLKEKTKSTPNLVDVWEPRSLNNDIIPQTYSNVAVDNFKKYIKDYNNKFPSMKIKYDTEPVYFDTYEGAKIFDNIKNYNTGNTLFNNMKKAGEEMTRKKENIVLLKLLFKRYQTNININ